MNREERRRLRDIKRALRIPARTRGEKVADPREMPDTRHDLPWFKANPHRRFRLRLALAHETCFALDGANVWILVLNMEDNMAYQDLLSAPKNAPTVGSDLEVIEQLAVCTCANCDRFLGFIAAKAGRGHFDFHALQRAFEESEQLAGGHA